MREPIPSLKTAIEILSLGASRLKVDLTAGKLSAFRAYLEELACFCQHTNLVSSADPMRVVAEHLLPCLALVPHLRRLCSQRRSYHLSLIDLGSGAGFPGLPLAVAIDGLQVMLVEATGKKARFLTQVVKSMGLGQRVSVLPERAEALAGQPRLRSSFDLATARGLGRLDVIMELALPLIASGGFLIALKSAGQLGQELPRASRSAALLGGSVLPVETLKELLPDRDHVLVIIKKENETPDTYPRPYPLIKRCPLGRASF